MLRVGCVLLAAGFSARFGSNKLLAQVEGKPLVQRALDALPARLFAQAAAVSQYTQVLELAQAAGYLPLLNTQAGEGISSSVKLGLSSLSALDGVLFSVCDQPWLQTASVQRLLDAFQARPDCIVALARAGGRGNPVIFPKDLFPALLALTGDSGGGQVIKRHPQRLLLVEAGDPRELDDVDRPDDLPAT